MTDEVVNFGKREARVSDLYFNMGYVKAFKGVSSVKDVKPENIIQAKIDEIKDFKDVVKCLGVSPQDITEGMWKTLSEGLKKRKGKGKPTIRIVIQ